MLYHKQTAKFIATVVQNMPEMSFDTMQGWIENPKALQKLLACLCPSVTGSAPEFKVFKTIKLGTGLKIADDFRKSLKDNGFKVGDWADDILGSPAFTVAVEETELDLVIVSVAELGFKNGATRKQIYARAKERGLDLCPSEVGPQLRLQYVDQPKDEWLIIAMEPIAGSDGNLKLFDVDWRDSALWLNGRYDSPDGFWGGTDRFVFVSPRK